MTITNSGTDSGTGPGADAPILAGIHHLKLPVTDLARSLEWYRSRLGYQVQIEFVERGTLMGCGLAHPAGGPDRLDELGQAHAGVHRATMGWILPEVLDPDGHTLRFYTVEHHTDMAPGEVTTIRDPRETAERLEREEAARA